MDPRDFDRDFEAWLDGELPPEAAARMQAAADATPELAERAALHREIDARIRGALIAEPAAVATVRAMAARARGAAPALRRPWILRGWVSAAAAAVLVGVTLMWWLCIGPFECRYLMAFERASREVCVAPGAEADDLVLRSGLPDQVGEARATEPAVHVPMDVFVFHFDAVRADYMAPDGSSFRVAVSESDGKRPSRSKTVERDGRKWWTTDHGGHRMVAFDCPGRPFVYCVIGPAGADEVWAQATALRDAIR
jgi:hypothetical protein